MKSNKKNVVYLTRQVEFAAAHRLYKEDFSAEENAAIYGKCTNPHGHGHNYVLEVTFCGSPDPKTEIVVHYQEMKRLLEELVVKAADHRNLNVDVPFMKGALPSSENIAVAIWNTLSEGLGSRPWHLHKIRLASTARSWVEYYGPEKD